MKLTILLALIFGGLCGDDADKMGGFFSLGEAEKMAEEMAVEGGEMAVEDAYIASSPEYTPTSPESPSVVLGNTCGEETLPEPMAVVSVEASCSPEAIFDLEAEPMLAFHSQLVYLLTGPGTSPSNLGHGGRKNLAWSLKKAVLISLILGMKVYPVVWGLQ